MKRWMSAQLWQSTMLLRSTQKWVNTDKNILGESVANPFTNCSPRVQKWAQARLVFGNSPAGSCESHHDHCCESQSRVFTDGCGRRPAQPLTSEQPAKDFLCDRHAFPGLCTPRAHVSVFLGPKQLFPSEQQIAHISGSTSGLNGGKEEEESSGRTSSLWVSRRSLRLRVDAWGVGPHHSRKILPSCPRSSAAMFAPGSTASPRVHLCSLVSSRKSPHQIRLALSGSSPSPTLLLCLISVVVDSSARPQHVCSVFSCSQSGARMSVWSHGPCRQASTNQKSILPEQPPKVEMDQGEKPALSHLGFSCYMLTLWTLPVRFEPSQPRLQGNLLCRRDWLQLRRIARSEWAILPSQEAAAYPQCIVCEHLRGGVRREARRASSAHAGWVPRFRCADKINWKLRRATSQSSASKQCLPLSLARE